MAGSSERNHKGRLQTKWRDKQIHQWALKIRGGLSDSTGSLGLSTAGEYGSRVTEGHKESSTQTREVEDAGESFSVSDAPFEGLLVIQKNSVFYLPMQGKKYSFLLHPSSSLGVSFTSTEDTSLLTFLVRCVAFSAQPAMLCEAGWVSHDSSQLNSDTISPKIHQIPQVSAQVHRTAFSSHK